MSRHASIDRLTCCASASATPVDWRQFVTSSGPEPGAPSPIDAFYASHTALIKLSSLVGSAEIDEDASSLLAGQILLGYVSATELFFRQAISEMVQLCPFTRRANRDQMIPFGALAYYGSSSVAHSLTERVSFSEAGTIKKQLDGRLGIKVRQGTSLERSIGDFDKLCQVRHALVHSHGIINSSNAAELLGEHAGRSHRTSVDAQCLQWVAAVTVNLVRDVTQELIRSTVWRWVKEGYLAGDGRADRPRIIKLLSAVGSQVDAEAGRSVSSAAEVRAIVRSVLADLTN